MGEARPWDPALLTPVLITYNRADDLAATLEQWAGSAAAQANLLILDNASSDRTPEVVAAFRARLPNLGYVRNPCNVGGPANILRAAEQGDSEYLWIIGDDDRWFLEDLTELAQVLLNREADVIRLGWLVTEGRGQLRPAMDLAEREPLFFPSLSMISATIFRRRLLVDTLPFAYQAVADAYPQLVPFLKAFEAGTLTVHSLERDLMLHTPSTRPGYYLGDLEWFSHWFRTSRFLASPRWRRVFCGSILHYVTRRDPSWLAQRLVLPMNALRYRDRGVPQGAYLASLLGYGCGWRCNILAAAAGYFLVPGFLGRWLDDRYRAWAGVRPPAGAGALARRQAERDARL
jgi:glycosyltransferase involved in cell wall biosynthesis